MTRNAVGRPRRDFHLRVESQLDTSETLVLQAADPHTLRHGRTRPREKGCEHDQAEQGPDRKEGLEAPEG